MKLPVSVLMVIFSVSYAHQYQVIQEKSVVEYVNQNCLDFEMQVIKFNDTANALNISLMLKVDLQENSRVSVRGFKELNNKYELPLFRYDTTLKQGAQMESFDILSLRMDYSRPPFTWPLKKGVTYRVIGWNPDRAKFLPNLPGGKWMFKFIGAYPNKTRILEGSWFIRIA